MLLPKEGRRRRLWERRPSLRLVSAPQHWEAEGGAKYVNSGDARAQGTPKPDSNVPTWDISAELQKSPKLGYFKVGLTKAQQRTTLIFAKLANLIQFCRGTADTKGARRSSHSRRHQPRPSESTSGRRRWIRAQASA